jgi:type VI secretion system protein ImpA
MRYDWLLEPISEAEPCGPDLDEAGDEKYLNYVLSVSGRIPDQYYDVREGKPFDRTTIKIKDELAAIGALLKETRDLRLLCIEARFHSFMGDLPGFADCLEAMAGLVERFWPDVHPKAFDGDFTLRQNQLSGLDDWKQVIQPLHHAPLVRDKRLGPVMFRYIAIATGATPKPEDEAVPSEGDVGQALAAEENRAQSDLSFDAASRAAAALAKLREGFIENSGYDFVPSFDRLSAFLTQVIELFRTARPELAGTAAPAAEPSADGSQEAAGSPAAASATRATGRVSDHATAAAALLAAENYFAAHEPSTPVLILVHQARVLVGKPLTYALEALLPDDAPRAMIKIQGELNVQLNMAQLKQLTDDMPELANGANETAADANGFAAASRSEAMTLMAEVEQFYKTAEPSSPVPTLLARASGFTNRDFNAIVRDMLGPPSS